MPNGRAAIRDTEVIIFGVRLGQRFEKRVSKMSGSRIFFKIKNTVFLTINKSACVEKEFILFLNWQ